MSSDGFKFNDVIDNSISSDIHKPLSIWRKLAYAAGAQPSQLLGNVHAFYLSYFLLEISKLSPIYVSILLFLGRGFDAITDPIIGFYVNKMSARFGKRPWLICSMPIGCIGFFFLFFSIESLSTISKFTIYAIALLLLQLGLTGYTVPFTAMTMVLSQHPSDRESLTAYRMFSEVSAVLLGVLVFGGIITPFKAKSKCSSTGLSNTNNVNDSTLERYSYMWGSAAICGIFALSALICFFGTKEVVKIKEKHAPFVKTSMIILRYKPFLYLMGSFLMLSLAFQFMQGNLVLYISYTLQNEDLIYIGLLCIICSALICLPIVNFLTYKIGKKWTFASVPFLNLVTMFGALLSPINPPPYLFYGLMVWAGFPLAIGFFLPWVMLPDVIDAFFLEHQIRYETIFYSLYVFFNKLAVGITLGISAAILGSAGYNITACKQPPLVGIYIRYMLSVTPIVFYALTLVLLYLYPLNTKRVEEIRSQLNSDNANNIIYNETNFDKQIESNHL